jgi:hypothetical protein
MKRLLQAWMLAALALPAWGANYTFPGALPAGCSGSNGSYTCGALALGWQDTITIASPKPATITVNGDFSPNTSTINGSGSASDLTIVVTGTLALGWSATIKANISAGAVTDTGGAHNTISGSISVTTGTLTLGDSTAVSGSLASTTGAITTVGFNTIGGNVTSSSGGIRLGYATQLAGALSTTGAITLDQSVVVSGAVTGGSGAVSVGYAARVTGALTTSSGTVSIAQAATLAACVKSTSSAAITIGYQASVNSVCCGSATCGTSCVVNNSTWAMPAACAGTAAPTLSSGTRYSFESWDTAGWYIRHSNFLGTIAAVSSSSVALTQADTTFIARPGLADSSCWSFESVNYPGYYLRHQSFVLKLHAYSNTTLYLQDTTFCLRSGLASSSAISFESYNYPGYYLQHKTDNSMILATVDGTAAVNGRATFVTHNGWYGAVDHYELRLPSTGLACAASTVTVMACADSSSPCTSGATTVSGQTATLAASAGTLGATSVTFDANGSATTTFAWPGATNGGTATVTLSNESSTATNARQCCPNGTSCSAGASCSSTFSTAGFIVAAAAGGSAATVPAQTAGSTSSTHWLRAVKTNTTTQACEAALSGSQSVNWAVQCNNPTTCSSGSRMSVTASSTAAVAGNANGSSAASTAVTMSFDANGNAPFSFNYADVGQVTLLASKAAGGSLQAALAGSSNAFVVKPAGFAVSAIQQAASPNTANPGASSAAGARFVKAGEAFGATVTATTASGAAAPNFGKETVPEGVLLTPALVLPAGGNAGTLTNASIAGGSFSNGVATVSNLSYSEVGIVTLTPALADGSYLGAGAVTGTASGNVGRFVPARFAASGGSVTHRSALACSPASAFSYLGENFRLGFTLTAQNASGTTTQNYTGSFAKLDPTSAPAWNLAGLAGTTAFGTASGRLSLGTSTGTWSNGSVAVTLTANAARATSPDGPFSAAFGIAPADSDGVALASFDMASTSGGSNDRARLTTVALRFGRLLLGNAIGPQDRTLSLPATAQHWNASAWATNTLDSCTAVAASAVSLGNPRRTLTAGDLNVTTGVTLSGGAGTLKLAQPGGARYGTVDVALSLGSSAGDASCLQTWTPSRAASAAANLAYLRGAWCGSAYGNDPAARATFGYASGRDAVIYRTENY